MGFMRNNPKLLMQMIPDGADSQAVPDSEGQQELIPKKSRMHDKI